MFEVKIVPIERKFAGLSLRDAHKQRTLTMLRQAALRMFLADGYDATTAEAIAESVGASVRTFFRYFATKDEVVFMGQGAWAKAVAASYMNQPDSLAKIDAFCESLIEAAEGMDRKSVMAYGQIVENSHVLRGKAAELVAISIDEIANAVAKKHGLDKPDAATRLFTEVLFATYKAAVNDWSCEKFSGPLGEAIRSKFGLFHSLFAGNPDLAVFAKPKAQPKVGPKVRTGR